MGKDESRTSKTYSALASEGGEGREVHDQFRSQRVDDILLEFVGPG